MPDLLIRDLDDALHSRLKERARSHRRSLAAEAREMLRSMVARDDAEPPEESLLSLAARYFGPEHGFDLQLPDRGATPSRPPPDFGETGSGR